MKRPKPSHAPECMAVLLSASIVWLASSHASAEERLRPPARALTASTVPGEWKLQWSSMHHTLKDDATTFVTVSSDGEASVSSKEFEPERIKDVQKPQSDASRQRLLEFLVDEVNAYRFRDDRGEGRFRIERFSLKAGSGIVLVTRNGETLRPSASEALYRAVLDGQTVPIRKVRGDDEPRGPPSAVPLLPATADRPRMWTLTVAVKNDPGAEIDAVLTVDAERRLYSGLGFEKESRRTRDNAVGQLTEKDRDRLLTGAAEAIEHFSFRPPRPEQEAGVPRVAGRIGLRIQDLDKDTQCSEILVIENDLENNPEFAAVLRKFVQVMKPHVPKPERKID